MRRQPRPPAPAGSTEPGLVFETRPIYYDLDTGKFLAFSEHPKPDRSVIRKAVSVRWQWFKAKWRGHPSGHKTLLPRSASVGTYYQQADGKWIVSVGASMQTELGPFDTEDEARLNFVTAFELEEMDKPFREVPFP